MSTATTTGTVERRASWADACGGKRGDFSLATTTTEAADLLGMSASKVRRLCAQAVLPAWWFGNLRFLYGPVVIDFRETVLGAPVDQGVPVFEAVRCRNYWGEHSTVLIRVLLETSRSLWGHRVTALGEDQGWVRVRREEILERIPMAEDRLGTLTRADRRSRR